jgi:hypothetical protein
MGNKHQNLRPSYPKVEEGANFFEGFKSLMSLSDHALIDEPKAYFEPWCWVRHMELDPYKFL